MLVAVLIVQCQKEGGGGEGAWRVLPDIGANKDACSAHRAGSDSNVVRGIQGVPRRRCCNGNARASCSYARSAVETLNEVFDNVEFQFGLANFLSRPNAVGSDSPLQTRSSTIYQMCTV